MDIYLIRHGETVDNIAGLYAGVRDSALTIHGVEQARRLGQHFAKNSIAFTHIFASPLSRASKTAQAIHNARPSNGASELSVISSADLIEQDFGGYEGKPFHARSNPKMTGRETHREEHKDDPDFVDVETKESMNARADCFLNEHLIPLLASDNASTKLVVAVVSHGMLLSHLWRRLLLRLPAKSITVAPEVVATRENIVLQHLGGWSNTGYLELALSRSTQPKSAVDDPFDVSASVEASGNTASIMSGDSTLRGWSTLIRAIDRKDHLVGLKRQRGGIGRSAHDESQKRLDGFFKKQRTS